VSCAFRVGSGQVRCRLGDGLVDRYLEFVAGRRRPNTLRAVAFDLKAFFTVTGKEPVEITAADVFGFPAGPVLVAISWSMLRHRPVVVLGGCSGWR
jgi:hypothetical protein